MDDIPHGSEKYLIADRDLSFSAQAKVTHCYINELYAIRKP